MTGELMDVSPPIINALSLARANAYGNSCSCSDHDFRLASPREMIPGETHVKFCRLKAIRSERERGGGERLSTDVNRRTRERHPNNCIREKKFHSLLDALFTRCETTRGRKSSRRAGNINRRCVRCTTNSNKTSTFAAAEDARWSV